MEIRPATLQDEAAVCRMFYSAVSVMPSPIRNRYGFM